MTTDTTTGPPYQGPKRLISWRDELGTPPAGLWGRLSPDLQGSVSGLRGDISELRGYCSPALRGDVSGLWGKLSPDLRGDVSELRGDISGLSGDATALMRDCSQIPHDARPCDISEFPLDLTMTDPITTFYVTAEKRVSGKLRKFYLEYPEMGDAILVQTYPYREYSGKEAKLLVILAFRQLPEYGLRIEAAR